MTKLKKREDKIMTKGFVNRWVKETGIGTSKSAGQKLIATLKLEEDEFTKHASVRQLTLEFLQSAGDFQYFYQGGKKELVIRFASALEEDLKKNGKDELVCKISSFIMKLVRQAKLMWSDDYLRRVLDKRYKDPISQDNALKRKSKPKQLESKTQQQEEIRPYEVDMVIKRVMLYESRKELINDIANTNPNGTFQYLEDYEGHVAIEINLPIIVKVNPKEQKATYELDEELIAQNID